MIWLSAIVLIILFAIIFNSPNENHKKTFLRLSAIVLILLLGCRNAEITYGSDLNNYYRLYETAIHAEWNEFISINHMDIGYLVLNYVFAQIIPWPQAILFIQAIFCIVVFLYFVYKNTDNVQLATIFFVCFGPFQFFLSGFRQSIAMCVGLLMFEVAKEKKWVKYIILLILAISMHQTAIVLLPIYFLVNLKHNMVNNFFIIVLSFGLMFFSREFVELGNDLFDREYSGIFFGSIVGGIIALVIYVIAIATSFMWNSQKIKENKEYLALMRMLLIGIVLYAMRFDALVFERVSLYYTPVCMPLLADNLGRGTVRTGTKIIAVGLSVGLFIWRIILPHGSYTFFWQ